MKKLVILFSFFSLNSYCQTNISLAGHVNYDSLHSTGLAGVGGYVDEFGNEYAIVGANKGVSIVDITNPSAPNEIIYINGCATTWREVGVYNNHAYISSVCYDGVMIIDLNSLPGIIDSSHINYFFGDITPTSMAHSIYVSKDGKLFLNNPGFGGVIFYDLTLDPKNPKELGLFDVWGVHDSYARGDTLYCANINEGFFSILNISNPSAIQVLATESTPFNGTHNCWLSDDGNYLFTTDEVSESYITTYDISDFNNIVETDRVKRSDTCNSTPHNTYFVNDFLVTAYYSEGVTIHDVSNPSNMVEVGHYDTNPSICFGVGGAWGAYPFFPSGNIIVSDMYEGLFIFSPNYVRAATLQGIVTDAVFGNLLNDVNVSLVNTITYDITGFDGLYALGTGLSGNVQVVFSKTGYVTDTVIVQLFNDSIVTFDYQLEPISFFSLTGTIRQTNTNKRIDSVKVQIENTVYSYTTFTDLYGNFTFSQIFNDPANTYCNITASKWGYVTYCDSGLNVVSSMIPFNIYLDRGYFDDFCTDLNWQISSDASTGEWERVVPNGTSWLTYTFNPYKDVAGDCFGFAYVTGNSNASSAYNFDDLDSGYTQLISKPMDLTNYVDPYLNLDLWISEKSLFGGPSGLNKVSIYLYSDNDIFIDYKTALIFPEQTWTTLSYRIKDFTNLKIGLKIKIVAEDYWNDEVFEVGIDKVRITGEIIEPPLMPTSFLVYPNPTTDNINIQSPVKISFIHLIDFTGKIVAIKAVNDYAGVLNLHSFSNGIYELKAVMENGDISYMKIAKQ